MDKQTTILQLLQEELPNIPIKTDPLSLYTYGKDASAYFEPNPAAILFPTNTDQVIQIVQFANKHLYPLVPSGGRTGLSAAATATNGELVVSFDKMDKILRFNEAEATVDVEPGLIISNLQDFARSRGLFYPIEYAATGSSQVGGNIATNAGGIQVIRYGMTRDWITGLKVVSGKGELLNSNKGLRKNATGYDLRHLFIGSEGTLGFIVEATIQLCMPPKNPSTFLFGLKDQEKLLEVLQWMRQRVSLLAFEFFSGGALEYALQESSVKYALSAKYPYYALVEFDALIEASESLSKEAREQELFEVLSQTDLIEEGTLALDESDRKNLWAHRELIPVSLNKYAPYKNDISVRIGQIPGFLRDLEQLLAEYPALDIVCFGHLGDGNIHINIPRPAGADTAAFKQSCEAISRKVYHLVEAYAGSISAEHGIGLIKKEFLSNSRSSEEISYMKAIKTIFDPNNILNPGKIF
ncbi:MAG: FAD-binding oxidoreductase [Saprospiraceae bacterium]|nr:FAD-binding oxidoreductase [Saprospiraceae bacterium]